MESILDWRVEQNAPKEDFPALLVAQVVAIVRCHILRSNTWLYTMLVGLPGVWPFSSVAMEGSCAIYARKTDSFRNNLMDLCTSVDSRNPEFRVRVRLATIQILHPNALLINASLIALIFTRFAVVFAREIQ
ncbi:hypothetical protein BDN71DRAFT_811016 [Pleurotus eryngii]|uniref:Uncharacterized protein n=1 Tax=Pleurotus eryngii TaxID=5323 RepID=A0A9P5ZWJ1_PLEER|nr:hypothetical protein BDN71DRAFT_811016 [Pleurotus eryngii]